MTYNTDPGADFAFNMNYIATFRGRAGYAMDRTLLYVTAGGAYAQGNINGINFPVPNNLHADSWGWSVGAGVEQAVSEHMRLRLEYLYTHFGTTNYSDVCCNVDWNWGGEHEFKVAAIWNF